MESAPFQENPNAAQALVQSGFDTSQGINIFTACHEEKAFPHI